MAKESNMTMKKMVLIITIASFMASLITGISLYAVNNYKRDMDSIKLEKVCSETLKLKSEVTKINTENEYRDNDINEFKKFKDADTEWKILDAEWKGMISEAINQSMYYGDSGKLGDLLKISEENKKNVSKKNKVE